MSHRRILPAALLCFFFGWAGIHRFYAGKFFTGILQFFTLGGFGIWYLIDLILILLGEFKDDDGLRLTRW